MLCAVHFENVYVHLFQSSCKLLEIQQQSGVVLEARSYRQGMQADHLKNKLQIENIDITRSIDD